MTNLVSFLFDYGFEENGQFGTFLSNLSLQRPLCSCSLSEEPDQCCLGFVGESLGQMSPDGSCCVARVTSASGFAAEEVCAVGSHQRGGGDGTSSRCVFTQSHPEHW